MTMGLGEIMNKADREKIEELREKLMMQTLRHSLNYAIEGMK